MQNLESEGLSVWQEGHFMIGFPYPHVAPVYPVPTVRVKRNLPKKHF